MALRKLGHGLTPTGLICTTRSPRNLSLCPWGSLVLNGHDLMKTQEQCTLAAPLHEKPGFVKHDVPVWNQAKEIANDQGCSVFPWDSTFPSVAATKQNKKTASNYPCYSGSCMKIVFRDIFFVLIFFGPEWGIGLLWCFVFFFSHSNWKLYLKNWKARNILYLALHRKRACKMPLACHKGVRVSVGRSVPPHLSPPSPLQAPSLQVSGTFAGTLQQLHPDGDADVPAQRDQPNEAGNDGWPQQVLDCGRSVRVPIEDLKKGVGKGRLVLVWSWPQFLPGKSQKSAPYRENLQVPPQNLILTGC